MHSRTIRGSSSTTRIRSFAISCLPGFCLYGQLNGEPVSCLPALSFSSPQFDNSLLGFLQSANKSFFGSASIFHLTHPSRQGIHSTSRKDWDTTRPWTSVKEVVEMPAFWYSSGFQEPPDKFIIAPILFLYK